MTDRNNNPLIEYLIQVIEDSENLPDDHIWLNAELRDSITEYAGEALAMMKASSMNVLLSPEEVHAAIFSTLAIEKEVIEEVIRDGEGYYTISKDGTPHLAVTGEGWRQLSKTIAAVVIAVLEMLNQQNKDDDDPYAFPPDGINLEDF